MRRVARRIVQQTDRGGAAHSPAPDRPVGQNPESTAISRAARVLSGRLPVPHAASLSRPEIRRVLGDTDRHRHSDRLAVEQLRLESPLPRGRLRRPIEIRPQATQHAGGDDMSLRVDANLEDRDAARVRPRDVLHVWRDAPSERRRRTGTAVIVANGTESTDIAEASQPRRATQGVRRTRPPRRRRRRRLRRRAGDQQRDHECGLAPGHRWMIRLPGSPSAGSRRLSKIRPCKTIRIGSDAMSREIPLCQGREFTKPARRSSVRQLGEMATAGSDCQCQPAFATRRLRRATLQSPLQAPPRPLSRMALDPTKPLPSRQRTPRLFPTAAGR